MRVVRDASQRDESRIVVRAIPIVRPLPDVASHVIEAVAVRRIVCDRADANETVFPFVHGLYRMRDFGRQPNLKQLVKLTAVKRTTKHETSDWTVRFHSDISVSMQSCEGTDLGCFFVELRRLQSLKNFPPPKK